MKNFAPVLIIYIALLILIGGAISGCSCDCTKVNTVFIRDTTYSIKPEDLRGSGTPFVVADTVVKYLELNKQKTDTMIYFEYLPGLNTVKYVSKHDTIFVKTRDTLNSVKTEYKVVEYPFWSKVGLVIILLAIGIVMGFILNSLRKKENESEANN